MQLKISRKNGPASMYNTNHKNPTMYIPIIKTRQWLLTSSSFSSVSLSSKSAIRTFSSSTSLRFSSSLLASSSASRRFLSSSSVAAADLASAKGERNTTRQLLGGTCKREVLGKQYDSSTRMKGPSMTSGLHLHLFYTSELVDLQVRPSREIPKRATTWISDL